MVGKKKKKEDDTFENVEIEGPRSIDLLFDNSKALESEKSTHEKTLEKALDELFSTDGIDLKTDISNKQISSISRGYIFADIYKCRYMSDLIRHILELSVSKERKGRGEFVKILQSNNEPEDTGSLRLIRRKLLE